MNTYDRLAREIADDKFGMPFLTPPQRKRDDEILTLAETLFARFGRVKITMAVIAHALRISGHTLRWHYSDTDAMLGEILHRHLRRIGKYIGDLPRANDPQEQQRRKREAYLAYTRGNNDGFTDVHKIFVLDRSTLPHDIREPIDQLYAGLGLSFAGNYADEIMELLDNPRHDLAAVERRFAAARAADPNRSFATEFHASFAKPAAKPSPPPPDAAPRQAAPPPSCPPSQSPSQSQPPKLPNLKAAGRFGPDMPAGIAYRLLHGDLTWLRPAGLGSAGLGSAGLGSAGLPQKELNVSAADEELEEQSLPPQTPRH
jgi:AcrR family transcriptional regulator